MEKKQNKLHTIYPYLEKDKLHNTFSKWEVLNKMKNKCALKMLLNCDFFLESFYVSFILLEQERVYLSGTDRCKICLGDCSDIKVQTSNE